MEKFTWEGMARLFIHLVNGTINPRTLWMSTPNLNPCVPRLDILKGWEGDADGLMNPTRPSHGAVFDNPSGPSETAQLKRPENTDKLVGSGIFAGDFDYYKDLYGVPRNEKMDLFRILPRELSFSHFVRRFLNNEIDVDTIVPFQEFMAPPPAIDDVAAALSTVPGGSGGVGTPSTPSKIVRATNSLTKTNSGQQLKGQTFSKRVNFVYKAIFAAVKSEPSSDPSVLQRTTGLLGDLYKSNLIKTVKLQDTLLKMAIRKKADFVTTWIEESGTKRKGKGGLGSCVMSSSESDDGDGEDHNDDDDNDGAPKPRSNKRKNKKSKRDRLSKVRKLHNFDNDISAKAPVMAEESVVDEIGDEAEEPKKKMSRATGAKATRPKPKQNADKVTIDVDAESEEEFSPDLDSIEMSIGMRQALEHSTGLNTKAGNAMRRALWNEALEQYRLGTYKHDATLRAAREGSNMVSGGPAGKPDDQVGTPENPDDANKPPSEEQEAAANVGAPSDAEDNGEPASADVTRENPDDANQPPSEEQGAADNVGASPDAEDKGEPASEDENAGGDNNTAADGNETGGSVSLEINGIGAVDDLDRNIVIFPNPSIRKVMENLFRTVQWPDNYHPITDKKNAEALPLCF